MVPLIVQQIIANTQPFWTSILAWHVIGDKLSDFEIFAMLASFFGILLIAFSGKKTQDEKELEDGTGSKMVIGCLMCLTCAMCLAIVGV